MLVWVVLEEPSRTRKGCENRLLEKSAQWENYWGRDSSRDQGVQAVGKKKAVGNTFPKIVFCLVLNWKLTGQVDRSFAWAERSNGGSWAGSIRSG